jgi:hypothetical protein
VRPLQALRAVLAIVVAFLALASLAALAAAEQDGRDGVKIVFNASISPNRLPRHESRPVSLTLSGAVRSADGSAPPPLTSLELAFGARGGLSTAGLPRCRGAQLRNATQRQALAQCSGALVGRGTISTEVLLDPEKPVPARASVLAFNGTAGGRPAVWLHAYSASPPVSFALPFSLRRLGAGGYGIALQTPVSSALGRWLRLRSFRIDIGRRYTVHGVQRSYLSASCPLPPRFHSLNFPLARATYRFAPAPTIITTILRSCSVRE